MGRMNYKGQDWKTNESRRKMLALITAEEMKVKAKGEDEGYDSFEAHSVGPSAGLDEAGK